MEVTADICEDTERRPALVLPSSRVRTWVALTEHEQQTLVHTLLTGEMAMRERERGEEIKDYFSDLASALRLIRAYIQERFFSFEAFEEALCRRVRYRLGHSGEEALLVLGTLTLLADHLSDIWYAFLEVFGSDAGIEVPIYGEHWREVVVPRQGTFHVEPCSERGQRKSEDKTA